MDVSAVLPFPEVFGRRLPAFDVTIAFKSTEDFKLNVLM
jgi:hypothetical protein